MAAFEVGKNVNLLTSKSHLPQRGLKIVEIHDHGVVLQNDPSKFKEQGNYFFYPWSMVDNLEIILTPEKPIYQTAGKKK